ncbi:MAG: response regulator [Gemmatimonadetes bacterium]|nr:response regulator [Gemmatimonadota bacterium]
MPVEDLGATILIVDDEETNVILLKRLLGRVGYRSVHSTSDSREVLALCESLSPDIVLLDLRMPHLDGFEVLRQLEPFTGHGQFLPVVALTGDPSEAAKDRALNAGAMDFLAKPFSMTEVLLRVRNLLRARRMHLELRSRNSELQAEVVEKTRDLNAAQLEILERLAQAVEFRDEKTGEHTHRVGDYAGRLAVALSLPEEQVELIRQAAPLHDVGKVGLPDAILLKPGPLTAEEFEIVKTHTVIGARLLSGSRSPLLQCAEVIALGHHERWDGSGYPHGLSGESIPLPARIVAVVDFFDALTHDRPYRKAWTGAEVMRSIEEGSGTHFDPRVAEAFLAEFSRLAG